MKIFNFRGDLTDILAKKEKHCTAHASSDQQQTRLGKGWDTFFGTFRRYFLSFAAAGHKQFSQYHLQMSNTLLPNTTLSRFVWDRVSTTTRACHTSPNERHCRHTMDALATDDGGSRLKMARIISSGRSSWIGARATCASNYNLNGAWWLQLSLYKIFSCNLCTHETM